MTIDKSFAVLYALTQKSTTDALLQVPKTASKYYMDPDDRAIEEVLVNRLVPFVKLQRQIFSQQLTAR